MKIAYLLITLIAVISTVQSYIYAPCYPKLPLYLRNTHRKKVWGGARLGPGICGLGRSLNIRPSWRRNRHTVALFPRY